MKKEYDFSRAERRKFYCRKSEMVLPIYLDKEIFGFFRRIAAKQHSEISHIVNDVLKREIEIQRTLSKI